MNRSKINRMEQIRNERPQEIIIIHTHYYTRNSSVFRNASKTITMIIITQIIVFFSLRHFQLCKEKETCSGRACAMYSVCTMRWTECTKSHGHVTLAFNHRLSSSSSSVFLVHILLCSTTAHMPHVRGPTAWSYTKQVNHCLSCIFLLFLYGKTS